MKNKYVVAAAQTLGFSCNDCADIVKTKTLEARVDEEDALYLPDCESFAGFSRAYSFLQGKQCSANFIFQINK